MEDCFIEIKEIGSIKSEDIVFFVTSNRKGNIAYHEIYSGVRIGKFSCFERNKLSYFESNTSKESRVIKKNS
jgi:hypothetical protein